MAQHVLILKIVKFHFKYLKVVIAWLMLLSTRHFHFGSHCAIDIGYTDAVLVCAVQVVQGHTSCYSWKLCNWLFESPILLQVIICIEQEQLEVRPLSIVCGCSRFMVAGWLTHGLGYYKESYPILLHKSLYTLIQKKRLVHFKIMSEFDGMIMNIISTFKCHFQDVLRISAESPPPLPQPLSSPFFITFRRHDLNIESWSSTIQYVLLRSVCSGLLTL